MGGVEIRNEEVVLKINFYLSVLPRAGSDPGPREIRREEENELMGEVHLHEYIFKNCLNKHSQHHWLSEIGHF